MWKFLEVAPEWKTAFRNQVRLRNIVSIEILAYLAIFFLFILMYVDYLRYQSGGFARSKVLYGLFLNHLMFAYHIIPLSILWLHRKKIRSLEYKGTDRLIYLSFAIICLTLFIMAMLSYMDRYSLIMYAIYILVANFMFLISHRLRLLFNLLSLLLISIFVFSFSDADFTLRLVLVIEAAGITIPAFFIASFRYNDQIKQFVNDQKLQAINSQMEKEQAKNEELLLNLLPKNIAEELKTKGLVQPKSFPEVSIMFIDFANFSQKSASAAPEQLVQRLDFYFSTFDQIMDEFKLEKIKTLGDGYMCIAGIGNTPNQACINMAHAAIKIRDFVLEQQQLCTDDLCFEVRIGIHQGPIVAGVVGKKKLSFDIWGSSVNIASRLESSSEIGAINISETVYHKIKNDFHCTYRGEIPVKGLGMMAQYFVEHQIPKLS